MNFETAKAMVFASALVVAATSANALLRDALTAPDHVMIYLLVIIVVAVRFGLAASVLASALSVAAYDLLFVPPYYTFAVSDGRNVLSFTMMFGIGVFTSGMMHRMRRQEDIARDERSRLDEAAKAATLRARTEAMRSSLLSAVSHDLRTPLASITGAATTLRDASPTLSPDQRVELSAMICEEAERLERLVANLLDMTRLESGAVEIRREWVPLDEMVGSAVDRIENKLAGRTLNVDIESNVPLLSVDPVLFEQVIVNLVENASKYTPAGTPIEIRARREGDTAVLRIADEGPGVAPGTEERIFEKFYRGSHVAVGGVGLGLPICRAVVEAHGGTITAENRGPRGLSFAIVLPLTVPAPGVPREGVLVLEALR